MTAIQESDIESWNKDVMAKNSLKSIIIQIEQNKLLTEEQKRKAIEILKESGDDDVKEKR